ncbi:MAG: hypothetical protein AB1631_23475 [Acidobacteriota bacterium]
MGQFDSEKAHLQHLVAGREKMLLRALQDAPDEESRDEALANLKDLSAVKARVEAMEDHQYVCAMCGDPFTGPACVRRKIVEIVETDAQGESSLYRYNSAPRIEVIDPTCAASLMPLDKAEAEPASVAALDMMLTTARTQRLALIASKES